MGHHVGEISHGHVTSLISLVYSLVKIELKQKKWKKIKKKKKKERKLLVQNIVTSYFLDLLRH